MPPRQISERRSGRPFGDNRVAHRMRRAPHGSRFAAPNHLTPERGCGNEAEIEIDLTPAEFFEQYTVRNL
jgi:hypothetical protein